MATITERKRDGGTRYTAQIRIKRDGRIVHTESRTFDKRPMAKAWAAKREEALGMPGALAAVGHHGVTVAQVIQWYIDDYNSRGQFGRSKLASLLQLLSTPLAERSAVRLTSGDIIRHVRDRRAQGVAPSTAGNDVIWLRIVFRRMRATRDIPLDLQVIEDASAVCKAEKMTGRSRERSRRPTLDELDRLLTHFSSSSGSIPMCTLVLFAIFSTRREDEICQLLLSDLDEKGMRILVRDMKSPTGAKGNHAYVALTAQALKIIKKQKLAPGDDRIFPYNARSVSSAFTRACKICGIDDLHFHDLRREGVSRLFELGYDIPKVAMVSGHRTWVMLKRYTQLYDMGKVDKYAKWKWLP